MTKMHLIKILTCLILFSVLTVVVLEGFMSQKYFSISANVFSASQDSVFYKQMVKYLG